MSKEEQKESGYLLTTRQAAKFMGVSETMIRDLTRRKYNPLPYVNVPGCKYPKYTKELLTKYFNSFIVDEQGEKQCI